MPKSSTTFALALLLSSSLCAAAPKYPAPPVAASLQVTDSPYELDKAIVHTVRIGNSSVYFIQSRGGSMALAFLGILTGGIGSAVAVGINSEQVGAKSAQMASGMSNSNPFDLEPKIRADVAKLAPNLLTASPGAMTISGALLVSADKDDQVRSALLIHVTDTSKPDGWSKTYFYHFATLIPVKDLQASGGLDNLMNLLAPDMDHAIGSTTAVIVDDLAGKFADGTPVRLRSDFLRPLGNVIIAYSALKIAERDNLVVARVDGKPGMIFFPTVDGVHVFQPGQFSIEQ